MAEGFNAILCEREDRFVADIKRRMQGSIASLRHDLNGLRTGRATASLLDPVQVDAYGQHTPITQVATISVPEPRLISVQVWDRAMVGAVERAIRDSNLGLSPTTEGQTLRIRIPELNEQRRKELVKVAHKYAEEARVAVRCGAGGAQAARTWRGRILAPEIPPSDSAACAYATMCPCLALGENYQRRVLRRAGGVRGARRRGLRAWRVGEPSTERCIRAAGADARHRVGAELFRCPSGRLWRTRCCGSSA
jgi:ribosome recycling factor